MTAPDLGAPPEPVDCAWCGGEVDLAARLITSKRGELFCSRAHRDASARAVRRLHKREESNP